MSREYFRACGKPGCVICREWMAGDPPRESRAGLACATLGLVLVAVFFLWLLPVMA
jgi:hypothetical protein